jgi:cobalt/nickel transport system permease protein
MHMADALLSPAVAGTMWAASAVVLASSSRRVRQAADDRRVPLMGVLGAFVFAAQMINFAIPGTGSSGHLGGGLLLSVLLGPHAAFLVMASVLVVQALFFADGGLLALGCNLVNLGFFPAFVAYPLVYRRLGGGAYGERREVAACVIAAVFGVQLGALAVVGQTVLSGVSALPATTFLLFMSPIHFAIGIVEGLATAAILSFVRRARPDVLAAAPTARLSIRPVAVVFLALALATGGGLSWFASHDPDGLEWSLARVMGSAQAAAPATPLHARLGELQQRVAVLPDYALPKAERPADADAVPGDRLETSLSGLVGSLLALAVALAVALALRRRGRPS